MFELCLYFELRSRSIAFVVVHLVEMFATTLESPVEFYCEGVIVRGGGCSHFQPEFTKFHYSTAQIPSSQFLFCSNISPIYFVGDSQSQCTKSHMIVSVVLHQHFEIWFIILNMQTQKSYWHYFQIKICSQWSCRLINQTSALS